MKTSEPEYLSQISQVSFARSPNLSLLKSSSLLPSLCCSLNVEPIRCHPTPFFVNKQLRRPTCHQRTDSTVVIQSLHLPGSLFIYHPSSSSYSHQVRFLYFNQGLLPLFFLTKKAPARLALEALKKSSLLLFCLGLARCRSSLHYYIDLAFPAAFPSSQ